jgi:hypothetical protein
MRKIVINDCFGGFGLSDEAFEAYLDRKGIAWEKVENDSKFSGAYYYHAGHKEDSDYYLSVYDIERDDPDLVAVVETLNGRIDSFASELKVVEIPDDVEWLIEEYDGNEWVAEKHRTWR